jgi:hypothetical protein
MRLEQLQAFLVIALAVFNKQQKNMVLPNRQSAGKSKD